jgi:hypothetical protein
MTCVTEDKKLPIGGTYEQELIFNALGRDKEIE